MPYKKFRYWKDTEMIQKWYWHTEKILNCAFFSIFSMFFSISICFILWNKIFRHPLIQIIWFWYHWKALNFLFPMILKSHDLDKWMAKYFISKMKHIEILKKRRKDTEKCTIQYLFSMSVSFPYHFSIFSVSEFFIGWI